MDSETIQPHLSDTADEDAIRAILHRMIEAWNAGDGTAFAAPFTDEVDFVVWEGTHLEEGVRSSQFSLSRSSTQS